MTYTVPGLSKPQTEQLLELLQLRGSRGVTPLDALQQIGSFRLGARIYDLRARGHAIRVERVRTPGGALVARYILVAAENSGQMGLFGEGA